MSSLKMSDVPEDSSQEGFTLVEVLLAVTLMTLILSATVSALRTFGNTQNSLERVITRVDEIRAVSTFLRNAFAATVVTEMSTMTLGPEDTGGQDGGYFSMKDSSEVRWRSTAKFGEDYGGSYFFRVYAADDQLLLQWQLADARTPGSWQDKPVRVLLENLESFSVSCWSRVDGKWRSVWNSSGSIPDKVKFEIRSSQRYWPDLIMRVSG